jgi:lipopolysaccharide export system permease protein
VVRDADIWALPDKVTLGGPGFTRRHEIKLETLEGFKPKILTSIFEGKEAYTISAAYDAITLLKKQGIDTARIRNLLYHMVVSPLFAIFLIVIFFFHIPPYARSANLMLTSFVMTGSALFVWGVLYFLYRIGRNGALRPEYGTLAFVAMLGVAAIYTYQAKHASQ